MYILEYCNVLHAIVENLRSVNAVKYVRRFYVYRLLKLFNIIFMCPKKVGVKIYRCFFS